MCIHVQELWDRHAHSMFIEHQKALLQNSTSNLRQGATTTNSLAFSGILRVQQLESHLTKVRYTSPTAEVHLTLVMYTSPTAKSH